MSEWTKYLEEYKEVAEDQLGKSDTVRFYQFFKDFFVKEKLEKYEWEDFQTMGDHIHAFNALEVAKRRAFGKPNHSIEHYRKSFL
ncbi:MAG: EVE domain-containing protein, partial [bacterium]